MKTKRMFNILPATTREYRGGSLHRAQMISLSIENYPEYRKWSHKTSMPDIIKTSRLFQDNRKTFRKLLGPRSFLYRGEFAFDCWLVDLHTVQLLVLTAKGKGTCYEAVTHRNGVKIQEDVPKIIKFLEYLACKLERSK